jgi:RNA polymerase sigma factor (sigma-70 family)
MKLLEKLAERDADWMRMAQSFGLTKEWARELVQEMYLKLYDKTTYEKIKYGDDDVNTFYVYITLRNLYYDQKRTKVTLQEIQEDFTDDVLEIGNCKEILEELLTEVEQTLEGMHWYDKKIFEIYYGDNETIRELSEGSKISQSSIFNTIKNVRTKIQQKHGEKYKEFRSGKEKR